MAFLVLWQMPPACAIPFVVLAGESTRIDGYHDFGFALE